MIRMLLLTAGLVAISSVATGARDWQSGTWTEVKVTRPRVVIGLQPRPPSAGSQEPRMMEIKTYVIDSDTLRLELKEPAPRPRQSVDALAGERVVFALEKNTVYIQNADGTEHRLQVTKKLVKEQKR